MIRQEVLRWFYVGAIDCRVRDRQVLETPKENEDEEESISAFLRTDESRAASVWPDVRGGQRKMQLKDSLSREKKRKKKSKASLPKDCTYHDLEKPEGSNGTPSFSGANSYLPQLRRRTSTN